VTQQPEHHDDEDVPAILLRVTDDGPGDIEDLPESDFISFATDEVEDES
jgi:hypothetical protein